MAGEVFVKTGVTESNQESVMETLLDGSGFWKHLETKCAHRGKTAATCKVIIKPNISIASQKELHSYTDPALVNHLTLLLKSDKRGYQDVTVVESENMYHIGYPEHTPDKVAKHIEYDDPVVNLSDVSEPKECFHEYNGQKINVCLSKRVLEADYFINFPKGRNHCMYKLTGAIKNLFGTIPTFDKIGEFHHKKSGLDVPHVVQFVHEKTPPDFTIMDWVRSVDDKDVHMSSKPLIYYKDANRLVASDDALAVDTYLHLKMGYSPFESEVVQPIARAARYPEITVIGDTTTPLKDWKTVPWLTRVKYRLLFTSIKLARKSKAAEKYIAKVMRDNVLMDVIDVTDVTDGV